jgi:hypothetical protein
MKFLGWPLFFKKEISSQRNQYADRRHDQRAFQDF